MIPYGISDYKRLREGNYYYIDKTRYIGIIEQYPPYLFLIRPRRFGKSLFLSMLEAYYDVFYKKEFKALFKDSYILDNPTKERNSYYVLRFDFSAVDSKKPDENFNKYINKRLGHFAKKYDLAVEIDDENSNNNLNSLFSYCTLNSIPLYVMIDEYDNFINELLVKDKQQYEALITGQEAIYKQFFKTLKAGTSGTDAPVKKMFITGVSPLAMYDVTSGYNIGSNITTDDTFNDMLGVTTEEVKKLIHYFRLTDKQNFIFDRIDDWYNGYKFNRSLDYTIYNTDMILYYLKSLIQKKQEPEELIDINVRSDYGKIRFLIQTDKKLNGNFSVLEKILSKGEINVLKIADSFSAFDIRDRNNFVSLLFYLGLLTIDKYEVLDLTLKIPNQTIKKILSEFIRKALEEHEIFDIDLNRFSDKLKLFSTKKDFSVFNWLGEQIKSNSKVRDYIAGESFIKGFLVAYLSLAPFYEVITEKEITKGFVDIYLQPITQNVPFGGAIEIKYIKRSKFSDALLQEKIADAREQLKQYKTPENVTKVILVFNGWELVWVGD